MNGQRLNLLLFLSLLLVRENHSQNPIHYLFQ